MNELILAILPYVTIVVFISGLTWRLHSWWTRPRAKAVLFPAAKNNLTMVARVARDIVLFAKTFKMSKSIWAMTFLFHFGLLLVLLGHLRILTEFGFLWSWLHVGKSGIDSVAFGMGMTAGGVFLAGAILLLSRRLTPTMRTLSIFQDYFVLGMLLMTILAGLATRLWMPVNVDQVRSYAQGILTLRPSAGIDNSLFLLHVFLAEIVIMYLPFSKLIHLVAKPVAESWTIR